MQLLHYKIAYVHIIAIFTLSFLYRLVSIILEISYFITQITQYTFTVEDSFEGGITFFLRPLFLYQSSTRIHIHTYVQLLQLTGPSSVASGGNGGSSTS